MSTSFSILDDGSRYVIIRAGSTFGHGTDPNAKEAYRKANRDLRCKQRWGALHNLMDSMTTGCFNNWKRQVAEMQQTINDLESEVARLICPF